MEAPVRGSQARRQMSRRVSSLGGGGGGDDVEEEVVPGFGVLIHGDWVNNASSSMQRI